MRESYCYWTVVDGLYADMAGTVIQSARRVGVFKDFHVWTDRPVEDAICHRAGPFDKWGCLFKLTYLRDAAQKLDYDYFIWFDTDSYFVRNPGNPLSVLKGSPMHITFESDLCSLKNTRPEWWGCPNASFVNLMRTRGVCSRAIFNVNGGLFIVHHDVIDTVFNLAFDFWHYCKENGHAFVDEPLLSYAMHMLCGNPHRHTMSACSDLWASDWTGQFGNRLPAGESWSFVDYFTGESFGVNPAIVHVMRSKDLLARSSQGRCD